MHSAAIQLPLGNLTISVPAASLVVVEETRDFVILQISGGKPLTIIGRPSEKGERITGLGERFGHLDQTGDITQGRISDLILVEPTETYFYIPVIYSSLGYSVVVESSARALWDLHATADESWHVVIAEDNVRVRIERGTINDVVRRTLDSIGRTSPSPNWGFGVWKTTLSGSASVLSEAQRLIDEDIPVTACWTYDYFDVPSNTGCSVPGTYPPGEYPDLPALTGSLHELGYKVLGYVQPGLFEGSDHFNDAFNAGWLVRDAEGGPGVFDYFNPFDRPHMLSFTRPGGAYVDFTREDASAWFGKLLRQALELGFDGWMQDMGEHLPATARLFNGKSGATMRNEYSVLYHQACSQAYADRTDVVTFARSGCYGSTPSVTTVWPGDQTADWGSVRGIGSIMPAGPTAGLSGVIAWGPDIGGIFDGLDWGVEGNGALDEELWIRWCQYGAFTPIMRDHLGFKFGAKTPIDMWSTPRTIDTFRRYSKLHLRLVPYLVSAANEARTGLPIIRALLVHYPDHPESWIISDQYLLGRDLLVAPVHVKGARTRRVWFPPGSWQSWWTDKSWEGPGWHTVPAPLEEIPVFIRSGGHVPLADHPVRVP